MAAGCSSDDEFDDTDLLNSVSGIWKISYPYIGFETDDGFVKYISSSYPYLNYELTITPRGKVVMLLNDEGVLTIVSQGTVKGVRKGKLAFDKNISSRLNEIGNFEAENPRREYRIIEKEDDIKLEINYSFKNSSGKPQFEGFVLERATL
jgi:hypothetical protein